MLVHMYYVFQHVMVDVYKFNKLVGPRVQVQSYVKTGKDGKQQQKQVRRQK
jgi:hypothetical protein